MALEHAEPGEVFDVSPLGSGLKNATSRALVKTPRFETLRVVASAGTDIPSDRVPGTVTILCLEGRVAIHLGEDTRELAPSQWVYLPSDKVHWIKAEEDSSLLMTIVFGEDGEGAETRRRA